MKIMRRWKRFLAMLLVALMVSTLVPVDVFAEELNLIVEAGSELAGDETLTVEIEKADSEEQPVEVLEVDGEEQLAEVLEVDGEEQPAEAIEADGEEQPVEVVEVDSEEQSVGAMSSTDVTSDIENETIEIQFYDYFIFEKVQDPTSLDKSFVLNQEKIEVEYNDAWYNDKDFLSAQVKNYLGGNYEYMTQVPQYFYNNEGELIYRVIRIFANYTIPGSKVYYVFEDDCLSLEESFCYATYEFGSRIPKAPDKNRDWKNDLKDFYKGLSNEEFDPNDYDYVGCEVVNRDECDIIWENRRYIVGSNVSLCLNFKRKESTKNTYTVTYIWDGQGDWFTHTDKGYVGSDCYVEDIQVSVRDMDVVAGYEFDGWHSNDVTIDADGTFKMPAKDIEILGHYNINRYNISYRFEGDIPEKMELPEGFKSEYSMSFGASDQVWETPFAEGYDFLGWTTTENVCLDENGFYKVPACDVEWIGEWSKSKNNPVDPAPNPTPVDPVDPVDPTPNPTPIDPVDPAPNPTPIDPIDPVDPAPNPTPVDPVPGPTPIDPVGPTPSPKPFNPVEPTLVVPAPFHAPVDPIVVNTLSNPFPVFENAADNDQFPMLVVEEPIVPKNEPAPAEPAIVQVADEETPLGNILLDYDHLDCILHLLLMLGAMVIFGVYTHNHKKLQLEIQELEEAIEGRKSGRITSAHKHVA